MRVELQRRAARALDKLLLQEQDQIAAALGETDADSLMPTVAEAGRTIAWEATTHGAVAVSGPSTRHTGAGGAEAGRGAASPETTTTPTHDPGIGLLDGEVVLQPDVDLRDAAVSVHLAAVAAERDLPVAREALNLLGRDAPAPTAPWPMTCA